MLGELGPDALAEPIPLDAPASGQCGDDGQSATVDLVRAGRAAPRHFGRSAIGHPHLNRRAAAAQAPRDAYDTAGKGIAVPDRIADQLSQDGDDIGQQRRWDAAGEFGREPMPGQPRASGVVGHRETPRAFGNRGRHKASLRRSGRAGTAHARGSRTSATVPPPSRGRSETHPFCRSTTFLTR
jgi:hypothetical protein